MYHLSVPQQGPLWIVEYNPFVFLKPNTASTQVGSRDPVRCIIVMAFGKTATVEPVSGNRERDELLIANRCSLVVNHLA